MRILRVLAAFAVIGACAATLYHDVYQRYRVNVEYRGLFAEVSRAGGQSDPYRKMLLARTVLHRARELDERAPDDIRIDLLAAASCSHLGYFDEGIRYCTDALRRDRRPEIYFLRGELHMMAGRRDRAIADMVAASEFTPIYLDRITDASLRAAVDTELRRRQTDPRQAP